MLILLSSLLSTLGSMLRSRAVLESDDAPNQVPIRDLKVDPTAEDLMNSPPMESYVKLALAVMGHKDVHQAVEPRCLWKSAIRRAWPRR